MDAAATVFADADEEFASLGAVKARLEEFKQRHPKDYSSTYMHLSTPSLFAPFVRLELMCWDPLFADSAPGGGTGGTTGGTGGSTGGTANGQAGPREGVHKGFDKQGW